MDLNEMLVFVRVVQAGSFSAAARQLGMPKSTVSRKVSELEDRLGARLLQRTTRKLGLTDAGRIYFTRAARIVAEAHDAEEAVGSLEAVPRGLLRVTAPLSFALLGKIVSEYLVTNADVQVEIYCSDRTTNLVEEGFDVAIRAGTLADSSLVARDLGTMKRVLVAAPAYCKANGTPTSPSDLAKHSCLAFNVGPNPNLWTLVSGDQRIEVRVTPRLAANDVDILHASALAGIGIAWLPVYVCDADIRDRRLRHVLADWCSVETPLHAVYPTARLLSPKVATFIDAVQKALRGRF